MFWVDIVFIVLIVLFGLWGIKQGFLSSMISLIGIALSIVLAVWLAPPFAGWIDGLFHGNISNFFSNTLNSIVAGFGNLDYTIMENTEASVIIDNFEVNGIIKVLLGALLGDQIINSGDNVLAWFSLKLGGLLTTLVAAAILFFLIRIVLALLSKLFDKITQNRTINGLDRVLGFFFGAFKGFVFVAVLVAVLNILCVLPPINDFVTQWLDKTSILKDYANWIFNLIDDFASRYTLSLG